MRPGDGSLETSRRKWQGRKDSNPRPSVLETDALTRLSYAPMWPIAKSKASLGSSESWRITLSV